MLIAAVSAVLGAFIIDICLPKASLVIYNETKGTLVYKASSKEVLNIYYKYQQSYDHGIIEEFFVLHKNKIIPILMIYDTDSYDYHGSRYKKTVPEVKEGRCYVNIREHSGYSEIRYRIGYTIKQEMQITTNNNTKTMLFQDFGDPGDLLIMAQFRR